MEKCKKISGTWRGFYDYLKPESLATTGRVPFTLVIKQGWFWRFAGTVTEEQPLGMPGNGRVEGYFSFPRVEFTKRMPVGYFRSGEGDQVSMTDYVRSLGIQCEGNLPHPPIFYEGTFCETGRVKGTWIIQPTQIPLPGGNSLPMSGASGDWQIEFQAAAQ